MGTSLRGLRWLRVVQFLISISLSLFSYSLQGTPSPQESWSSLVQDHWKFYRGNGSFVFPLHSSSFLLPKQIYLHSEVNSLAKCAFHWLSSIEGLFEHSGSFEGKTVQATFLHPTWNSSEITLSEWMHLTQSLDLLALCQISWWFICQSAHILHDFHEKNILRLFMCLFRVFPWNLVVLATLFLWYRKVTIFIFHITKLIFIGIGNRLKTQGT